MILPWTEIIFIAVEILLVVIWVYVLKVIKND